MRFRDHLYARLESLPQREFQAFPHHLLPRDSTPAAVLLPLWPAADGGVEIVFTRRTETLPTHAGQVSFPGGRHQQGDGSLEDTALREAGEELGLERGAITVMGRLDDAWSFHGHHVVPYVGWLQQRPALIPDPREVAEVLIADLRELNRPQAACRHEVQRDGRPHTTQAYRWDGGYVWGLTADILLELLLWINGQASNRGQHRLRRMLEQVEGLGQV